MRKMMPIRYYRARSTDPSVPLMKIVNEGKSVPSTREFLLRTYNLDPAMVDRMLAGWTRR